MNKQYDGGVQTQAEGHLCGGVEGSVINHLLSPKLARRLLELDIVLDLLPCFAEVVMGDLLDNIIQGDFETVMGGYDLDDPERTKQSMHTLADRWKAEDAMEES